MGLVAGLEGDQARRAEVLIRAMLEGEASEGLLSTELREKQK
jgi:hypothetical protein